MITQRVKLLVPNRLVGSHVHAEGDVVEMPQKVAREWVKAGHGAVTALEPTPIPGPGPSRAEQLRRREESALAPGPARSERALSRPRQQAAS
jgi:hypothetical protein